MTNYELTKDDGFLSSIYERFQTNFFIIRVDEAGDFAYGGINPAYEKTIGLSNEEIVGKRPEEVRGMSPEQAAAVRANCRRCLAAGEMITYEEVPTVKGKTAYWQTRFSPIFDESGNIYQIAGSSVDVTQVKDFQRRLQLIAETIYEVFWMTLPDEERILHVSSAYERIWGRSRKSLFADPQSFLEAVHPDDRKEFAGAVPWFIQGEWRRVFRILRPDGTLRWIQDCGYPMRDEISGIAYMVGAAHDITSRKQAEDALCESEERYRSLFNNASEGILVAELGSRRFCHANPAICEMLGYSEHELIGLSLEDIHPEESLNHVKSEFDALARGEKAVSSDIPCLRKNGKITYCDIHVGKVLIKGVEHLMGRFIDITERKASEEALRNAYGIINRSPAVVFLWQNAEGWPVEFVSDNVKRLLGYTAEEFISGSVSYGSIIHPDDTERVAKEITTYSSEKERRSFAHEPYRIITKNGKAIWLDDRTYMRRDEVGNITHYEGIVFDISDRIRLERERLEMQAKLQQAQRLEAIGSLAGGIAHDFNNILTAILGYTQLAMDNVDDKKSCLGDLREVASAGDRAKDLVRQILTFSRQGAQEPRPVQVKLIAKEVLKLLRSSLPATIEIRDGIFSGAPVMADPTQIHQVLMNLCTNAGHAMQEEGGILEVGLTDVRLDSHFASRHPSIKPGNFLQLTVRDTGCGIATDVLDKIFDPFFTTKEKDQGTGLGLSVVHGTVNSAGGVITVYSEPGTGTEFNVYWPAIEREVNEAQVFESPLPTGTECILFVDDDKPIRNLGKRLLESLGYHVEVRSNGIEALEFFKADPERFDLVITDMTMPKMTGERLAEQLMAVRSDIPVILCTGFSARIDVKKASEMGLRAFVMKPIIKSDIARTVRKVLDEPKGRAQ